MSREALEPNDTDARADIGCSFIMWRAVTCGVCDWCREQEAKEPSIVEKLGAVQHPPKAGWTTPGVHKSNGVCLSPSDRPALEAKVAEALHAEFEMPEDACDGLCFTQARIALDAIFADNPPTPNGEEAK